MRKEALLFVSNLDGDPVERVVRIEEWLKSIDKTVSGEEASNVVRHPGAKARA